MADQSGAAPATTSSQPSASEASQVFKAEVPKEAKPGDKFTCYSPGGRLVEAVVPEGAEPGDLVPVSSLSEAAAAPAAAPAPLVMARPVPAAGTKGRVVKGTVDGPQAPTPLVIGVPVRRTQSGGSDDFVYDIEAQRDLETDRTVEFGWGMYAMGWCACCFCGPFGPIFWLCTWATHHMRPKEQRELFPRERAVARLSCCTAILALAVHLVVILGLTVYWRHEAKVCGSVLDTEACMLTPSPNLMPGETFLFECGAECGPARCYNSQVWGGLDGYYAGGSAICGAALQSGIVEEGRAGFVQVVVTAGRSEYLGYKDKGVNSDYAMGSFQGFIVLPADGLNLGNSSDDNSSDGAPEVVSGNETVVVPSAGSSATTTTVAMTTTTTTTTKMTAAAASATHGAASTGDASDSDAGAAMPAPAAADAGAAGAAPTTTTTTTMRAA